MNVRDYTLSQRYATAFLHAYHATLNDKDKISLIDSILFLKQKRKVLQLLYCTPFNKEIPALVINALPLSTKMKKLCLRLSLLLMRNRRMNLFILIIQNIVIAWDRLDTLFRFVISSTCPLQASQKNILVRFLQRETHGTALCTFKEDTSLIAGITITSDTYAWSNALRDRLKVIKHSIIQKDTP